MRNPANRRGSALVLAIWTIFVLSVMVLSFVFEARQQTGINLYVLSRNRARRLVDAGRILAEVVLTSYSSAPDWSEDQEIDQLLEDDRWVREKQALKSGSSCTIGPIVLDETAPETGVLTVKIEPVNSGEGTGPININELYDGSNDSKAMERWWMILRAANIPEEIRTEKGETINLWNQLIASWTDWRDEDSVVKAIDGEECGAETDWYEEQEAEYEGEEEEIDELKRRPRNGPIPSIRELSYVRGFRDFPAVLIGGVINPWERKEDQITVTGIQSLFGVEGSKELNVNTKPSVEALLTIPGIYHDPEDDDSVQKARELAQLVLDGLSVMPENKDVDPEAAFWPYEDWNDLRERVDDSELGSEAGGYLKFGLSEQDLFRIEISCEAGGMKQTCTAECYIRDQKVRYTRWQEN